MSGPRHADEEGRGGFQAGLLRRLLGFVLPHKLLVIAALLLFPLVAGVQLAQPIIYKQAIDGPIKAGDAAALTHYALAYLALVLLQAALEFSQSAVMQLVGQRAMRDIRERVEQDRNYALSVVRHVVTSRAANIPLERVLRVAGEMYDDFPYLQEHLSNVRDVWVEMG